MFQSVRCGLRRPFTEFSLQHLGRLRSQAFEKRPVSPRLQIGIQARQWQSGPTMLSPACGEYMKISNRTTFPHLA